MLWIVMNGVYCGFEKKYSRPGHYAAANGGYAFNMTMQLFAMIDLAANQLCSINKNINLR